MAAIAGYHAVITLGTDPVFAVVWATWATMWALFFVLLGLGRTHVGSFDLGRFTGWFLVWLGVPTCTVTALFLLDGRWTTAPSSGLAALVGLAAATVLSVSLTRAGLPRPTGFCDDEVTVPDDDVTVPDDDAVLAARVRTTSDDRTPDTVRVTA